MVFFPPDMIFRIPALLVAITVHEYAHAKTADKLGDPTPRYNGRLSLNPIDHIDPIGLLMLIFFKFGWAKPVPVNPANFRNYRKGDFWVSLAGVLANLLVALISMALLKLTFQSSLMKNILIPFVQYNVLFAIFNILPVPPLDGYRVLISVLSPKQARFLEKLETYGPLILITLVAFGFIGTILGPLERLVIGILNSLTAFL